MSSRTLEGVVVSDKMQKTCTVMVERRFRDPLIKKTMRKTKKYHAHDEEGRFVKGDRVTIQECRPLSKLKRWSVIGYARKDGGQAT